MDYNQESYCILQPRLRRDYNRSNIFSHTENLNRLLILTLHSDSNFQLDAVPKREASIQQRMELQKEMDALKVSFEKQVGKKVRGWTQYH